MHPVQFPLPLSLHEAESCWCLLFITADTSALNLKHSLRALKCLVTPILNLCWSEIVKDPLDCLCQFGVNSISFIAVFEFQRLRIPKHKTSKWHLTKIKNIYTTSQKFMNSKIFLCFLKKYLLLTKPAIIWSTIQQLHFKIYSNRKQLF